LIRLAPWRFGGFVGLVRALLLRLGGCFSVGHVGSCVDGWLVAVMHPFAGFCFFNEIDFLYNSRRFDCS
jgi:hypothetical protein